MLLGLGVLFAGTQSFDAEAKRKKKKKKRKKKRKKSKGGGYGTAGCGLGSLVFGAKPGIMQTFAVTTNGSFYSQWFGISFGSSNCDIPQAGMAAASFIESNKQVVLKNGAQGEGEALMNLADIFQCTDLAYFGKKVQENFQEIFSPENDGIESSRAISSVIQKDEKLSNSCSPSIVKG